MRDLDYLRVRKMKVAVEVQACPGSLQNLRDRNSILVGSPRRLFSPIGIQMTVDHGHLKGQIMSQQYVYLPSLGTLVNIGLSDGFFFPPGDEVDTRFLVN